MEKYEALWAFQSEDIKADNIDNEIKRSPTRLKLEKARDFIVLRQKEYKDMEDTVNAMADRKDVLVHAVEKAEEHLHALEKSFEANPPQDDAQLQALLSEVTECRETLRQYESEMVHIVTDSASHEKQLRTIMLETAKAKQTFDQLKVDYAGESKVKKEELEQQQARVKSMEATVDPELLAEYMNIKKHISPPVARLTYGQCSGCNTSLPSAILSKIRNGVLVECETCGRMIIQ